MVAVRLNCVTFAMTDIERKVLADAGIPVVEIEGATDEEIIAHAREADALMVVAAYVRGPVIRELKRCRLISRIGTGTDRIDVAEATRCGIPVSNLPDFSTEDVADHTIAMLLSVARQLDGCEAIMRAGHQPRGLQHMHRLASRTIGIVGFGRIGRAVAKRAAGFGMSILAVDPALTEAPGVEKVDLAEAIRRSDYLCLLCPLTPETREMLTMREFRQMKPGAVLVNTSRGGLVNEQDLVQALREGVLRYAAVDVFSGIDVFKEGGFPTDHPFFTLENVLITPHVAAYSEEAAADASYGGAHNVVEALSGRLPVNLVNPEVVPWWKE